MLTIIMIAVFVVGYVLIALENRTRINKAAIALIMCGAMWTIFMLFGRTIDPSFGPDAVNGDVWNALASTCEILVFLICAMTIVSLIDLNGGFDFMTRRITTRNKVKLVWIIALITFFLSAILDNLTTTIVMIMLMRKLLANYKERWIFAGLIIIAANAGGAWSPIGDVTTIMLWVRGNITAWGLISTLFLPSLVSIVVPCLFCARILRGITTSPGYRDEPSTEKHYITGRESLIILLLGVAMMLMIPVFKALTGLPPYLGMVIALGVMWMVTEIMYKHHPDIPSEDQYRVSKIIHDIDMTTILFFLGILMSVSVLDSAGVLGGFAAFLDGSAHNIYLMNTLIGLMSAVVDNVPLVAASIGMYPIADAAAVAASADPAYAGYFVQDGAFWTLLAFCAGRGGSLLIIGSAAGVVAMGLEKINFGWYLRNFTLMALVGYVAGIAVFIAEMVLAGSF
ncbi:MAG: sodium:proton antiporter NhaD [Alistipes sp.]|jgi:Na+/H+ antiporter NhaD/arsenite permease-like protein|nr:sodium:proton antiporter NhaD [Alistipes sp.]